MGLNMQYKRFLVFVGDFYYPIGGMDDCQSSFDRIEEAQIFAEAKIGSGWAQIFDCESRTLTEVEKKS